MQSVRRLFHKRQSLLLALVACALLVRAALPAGWMPSFSGGAIAVSVCSGEGRTTMWLDRNGDVHKSDPGKHGAQDGVCASASLVGVASLPLGEAAFLAPFEQGEVRGVAQAVTPGQGLAAPPPPQTGPPVLI